MELRVAMPGHQTRAMLPALLTTVEAEVVAMAVVLATPRRPRICGRPLADPRHEIGKAVRGTIEDGSVSGSRAICIDVTWVILES